MTCLIYATCIVQDKARLSPSYQGVPMPFLFPLLAILIWAANTVVSKAAAGVLDPAAISFYRWVIAALALTPLLPAAAVAPPARSPPLARQAAGALPAWHGALPVPRLLRRPQHLGHQHGGHRLPAAAAHPADRGLLLWPEAGQAGAARHEHLAVRGTLAAGSGQPSGTAAQRHQPRRRHDAAGGRPAMPSMAS